MTARGVGRAEARVDAVMVQPVVERLVPAGAEGRHGRALLRSFADDRRTVTVRLPGEGPATIAAYDAAGRLVERARADGAEVAAPVVPGGFTVVTR